MSKAQAAPASAHLGDSGHVARLGELLIQQALITREQLERALRVQATMRTYVPLGQMLVTDGALTRGQLTAALTRHHKRARLGVLLQKAGHITSDQLDRGLAHRHRTRTPLGRALVALGAITEETMREALCMQLHINFFDLDKIPLEPALARLVPEKFATRRAVVPLFRTPPLLVAAVDDPTDVGLVEDLQQCLRLRVEIVTSTTARISRAIARLYAGARPAPPPDPYAHPNVMIGAIHDREIADLAARILGVRILPPYWQQR
jgi:chorismate-pyruvate lyase